MIFTSTKQIADRQALRTPKDLSVPIVSGSRRTHNAKKPDQNKYYNLPTDFTDTKGWLISSEYDFRLNI